MTERHVPRQRVTHDHDQTQCQTAISHAARLRDAGHYLCRLPWQSLGLPDLRDAASEHLWYAVSENFQDFSANRINANVYGQLQIFSGVNTMYTNYQTTVLNAAVQ